MKNRMLLLSLLALVLLVASPWTAAADGAAAPLTLTAQKVELTAGAAKGQPLQATVQSAGKRYKLTAVGIHLKRLDSGDIEVTAVGASMTEIVAAVAGAPAKVEGGWRFSISADAAKAALGKDPSSVSLAGEFNSWNPSDAATTCKLEGGVWSVTIPLKAGKYQYKFVLDGGTKWKEDPSNPGTADDGHGGLNSMVTVE